MADPIKLYNNILSQKIATPQQIGSPDEFSQALTDPDKAGKIYDKLSTSGKVTTANIGTRNDFINSFANMNGSGVIAPPIGTNLPGMFDFSGKPAQQQTTQQIIQDHPNWSGPSDNETPSITLQNSQSTYAQQMDAISTPNPNSVMSPTEYDTRLTKYPSATTEETPLYGTAQFASGIANLVDEGAINLAKLEKNIPIDAVQQHADQVIQGSRENQQQREQWLKTHSSPSGAEGAITDALPYAGGMALSTVQPEIAPAVLGSMGASTAGEGMQTYDQQKAAQGISPDQYTGADEAKKAALGLVYGLSAIAPFGKFGEVLNKVVPEGVSNGIIDRFMSSPEGQQVTQSAYEKIMQGIPTTGQMMAKDAVKSAVGGTVSMAAMRGIQDAGDVSLTNKTYSLDDLKNQLKDAVSQGLLFSALAPITTANNLANREARWNANGEASFTFDKNGSPIEVVFDKDKNPLGFDLYGNPVKLTPSQESSTVTIPTDVLNQGLEQYKQSGSLPADYDRQVYSGRITNALQHISDEKGNVAVPVDSNTGTMAVIGKDDNGNYVGVDANGQKTTLDGSTPLKSVNVGNIYDALMSHYDNSQKANVSPEQQKQIDREQEISTAQQNAASATQSMVNPDTNSVVFANVSGNDNPVQITSGKIVYDQNGNVDLKNSDKDIVYKDANGQLRPADISQVSKVTEDIPSDQAHAQAQQIVTNAITAKHQNEDVRPYNVGEQVRANVNGMNMFGSITGQKGGKYLMQEGTTGQIIPIEPRQIINEDNLQGIENGSVVNYKDESSQTRQGEVDDIYSQRGNGIVFIDGEAVPTQNVIGLANNMSAKTPQNEGVTAGQTQQNVSEEQKPATEASPAENPEHIPEESQTPQSFLSQIPKVVKKGKESYQFEQVPVETTVGALKEIFGDDPQTIYQQASTEVTNSQKEIDGLAKAKLKGDMSERIAQQQANNLKQIELAKKQEYWRQVRDVIRPEIPQQDIEPIQQEEVQKEKKPFVDWVSRKLQTLGEPHDDYERILYSLINGTKLRWEDRKVNGEITSKGLGAEYRYSDAEIKSRENGLYGYVSDRTGLTPEELAHKIWEESGMKGDTHIILNLIHSVANEFANSKGSARIDMLNYISKRRDKQLNPEEMKDGVIEDAATQINDNNPLPDELIAELANRNVNLDDFKTINDFINFVEKEILPNTFLDVEPIQKYIEYAQSETTGEHLSSIKSAVEQFNSISGTESYVSPADEKPVEERPADETPNKSESNTTDRQSGQSAAGEQLNSDIAAQNPNLNPTEAQKEAGNYKKAHITIHGMDIAIENPLGSIRSGIDRNGNEWHNEMKSNYGYFNRTEGKDGDHIDCFIGPNPESENVFVVDQNDPESGQFDESKVMLGYNTPEEAKQAYLDNYEKNWKGFRAITKVSVDDFKKWLYDGAKQRKPFSEYVDTPEPVKNELASFDEAKTPQERFEAAKRLISDYESKFNSPVHAELFENTNDFMVEFKQLVSERNYKEAIDYLSSGQRIAGVKIGNKILINVEHNNNSADLTDTWLHEQVHIAISKTYTKKEVTDMDIPNIDSYIPKEYYDVSHYMKVDEAIAHEVSRLLQHYPINEIFSGKIDLSLFDDKMFPIVNRVLSTLTYGKIRIKKRIRPVNETGTGERGEGRISEAENPGNVSDRSTGSDQQDQKGNVQSDEDRILRENAERLRQLLLEDDNDPHSKRIDDSYHVLYKRLNPKVNDIALNMSEVLFRQGNISFPDYSAKMIDVTGDVIRPYLKAFYELCRASIPVDGMTSPVEVAQFDIDNFNKENHHEQINSSKVLESPDKTNENNGSKSISTTDGSNNTGAVSEKVSGLNTPQEDKKAKDQLSLFDENNTTNNGNGRILQANSGRISKGKSPRTVRSSEERERIERRSDVQSSEIPGTNGNELEPDNGQRDLLPRDVDVLNPSPEPALVPFNPPTNDEESFNPSRKYDDNIAAIEVLNNLIKQNRKATPEEKDILSRYVGFGGLKDVLLNPFTPEGWTASSEKFKDKVSRIIELAREFDKLTGRTDSLNSIRGSILNAHFTSSSVIQSIYAGIKKLGFNHGTILEPSAGIGNFITYMPSDIKGKSNITAVELDALTGNILKYLHDEAQVLVCGIQDAGLPIGYHDLVISNVPFGNYKIFDKSFKGEKSEFLNRIHNYFFVKGLDLAREGGIVSFVTSKGVLDAPGNESLRSYINKNADFLGAVRLPNNTFKKNANTEVVTDIIFLRKNTTSEKNNPDFVSTGEIEATHKDGEKEMVTVNNYFLKHPENMLGNMVAGGLYSRKDYTLEDDGRASGLANVIQNILPDNSYKTSEGGSYINTYNPESTENVKEGNIEYIDGSLMRKQEGILTPVAINEPEAKIKGYINLRNSLMDLIYSEYVGKSDAELNQLRKKLNDNFDSFVSKYKNFGKSISKIAKQDTDGYNVLSLVNEKGEKADIFSKRTIQPIQIKSHADNIDEAIVMSLYENAAIDIDRIAQLMNMPVTDVIEHGKGKIFELPEGGYVTRDEYLSGNVKQKLAQAQQAIENGFSEFQPNVDNLLPVIPTDIPAMQIESRLGSRWIPDSVFTDFAREILKSNDVSIKYLKSTDQYAVIGVAPTVEARQKYGTTRVSGLKILEHALHINPPVVFDLEKDGTRILNQKETQLAVEKYDNMRSAFEDWVYKSQDRRALLGKIYNDRFNTDVKRTYDGSHLNIAGINGITLMPHQKDAVWMVLQNNGGIIDHIVGAGKTFIMIAGTMEMKRTGIAKKPMILALKSTIPQIVESYQKAYPMAKILAPTEKDFTKDNRKLLFSRIANNEWDCIIMSHDNYGKIPHEQDILKQFIQEEINDVEDERAELEKEGEKQALKGLEIRLKNLNAKMEKITDMNKDNSLTFEQMGIDHIMVDESQQFKNLAYVTKQRGIAGLGKPDGSKRAFNLYVGMRYLQQKYGADKGTTFLSGTPISNSMVEMYLLLKYLRPNKMKELGLTSFDSWATTFASPSNDIEFTVTGDFKMKTRFREFINVPELSMLYREIADIRTDENLPLDKPSMKDGGYTVVDVDMNPDQEDYMQRLIDFAKSKGSNNRIGISVSENDKKAYMLKVTNLSSKLAIDMRLINKDYGYDPNGKIAKLVDKVKNVYDSTSEHKGTQLIFSDLGTPKNKSNKASLLRDYMEDELGMSPDTLNEIFGDSNSEGYKYPPLSSVISRLSDTLEMSYPEIDKLLKDAEESTGSFNLYDEIKKRLVEAGIPENEITYIHDYPSQRAKEKLFRDVNEGVIRVVLGSTQKLGTGVNVQKRIAAIHHLDVPWRPSDMEQRNGRGLRQGNWIAKFHLDNAIPVFAYATKRTLDAYKYQLNYTKQKFLNQVKSGDVEDRTISEKGGDSENGIGLAELVAIASGNPDVMIKAKLETEVDKLRKSKRNFMAEIYEAEERTAAIKANLPALNSRIKRTEENIDSVLKKMEVKDGKMVVNDLNGQTLKDEKGNPAERIDYAKKAIEIGKDILKNTDCNTVVPLFTINGLQVNGEKRLETVMNGNSIGEIVKNILYVHAPNGENYSFTFSDVPGLLLNNIQKAIERIQNILSSQKTILENNNRDLKAYAELLKSKQYPKEDRLQEAMKELEEVNKRLDTSNDKEEREADNIENNDGNDVVDFVPAPYEVEMEKATTTEHAEEIEAENKENEKKNPDESNLLPAEEYRHTKTGQILYNVKINGRSESYDHMVSVAKRHSPYGGSRPWNKFSKGFLFNNKGDAEAFKKEWDDRPSYKIIGKKGAALLDQSEEVTTRMDDLRVAREMERDGKDEHAIRLTTGWEKGVDGLWRYEIPDVDISKIEDKLQNQFDKEGKAFASFNLSDLSDIKRIYPKIDVDCWIHVSPEYRNTGLFSEKVKSNVLSRRGENSHIEVKAKTPQDVRSIFIHEVQHAIQNIEGFAQGGNLDTLNTQRNVESAGFKNANDFENAVNSLKERIKKYEKDPFWKINSIFKAEDLKKELNDLMAKYHKNFWSPADARESYEYYRRLAGEVEARNASDRMNMTPEERRNTLLSETADVTPEDQIVLMGGYDNLHFKRSGNTRNDLQNIADANGEHLTSDQLDNLNKNLNKLASKLWEGWADNVKPVKKWQEYLKEKGTTISDLDNYYMQYSFLPGKIEKRQEYFDKVAYKPFVNTLKELEKKGISYDQIATYAKLKHAPEYTASRLVQEALSKMGENVTPEEYKNVLDEAQKLIKTGNIDLAGKKAVEKRIGIPAEEYIHGIEESAGKELTDKFWNDLRHIADFSLDEEIRCGNRSKESADKIKSMFKWYVPLKNHADDTAESLYDYTREHGQYYVSPVRQGKGRKSESGDPFSPMISAAYTSIREGEENLLKQSLYRIVKKDKTGSTSVNGTWFVKDGEKANGTPIFKVADEVPYDDNDTPESYNQKVAEQEDYLKKLEEKGEAFRSGNKKLNLKGLFIKPTNRREHDVNVNVNGTSHTIRFHTNPRIPQAINGANDRNYEGLWGDILNGVGAVTRFGAAAKTMFRPTFIFITNPLRDIHMGLSLSYVDEGAEFTKDVMLNFPHAINSLIKYQLGKCDLSNPYDKMLVDYMISGAKTGISKILELKEIEGNLAKDIKHNPHIGHKLQKLYQGISDITENQVRLAVYYSAIKKGYSQIKAASMAKEITINFNRHGNGRNGLREAKSLWAFINVGFQALDNLHAKTTKNDETKKRMSLVVAANIAAGAFLFAVLSGGLYKLLSGKDDNEWLDQYGNLSEYERNNNFCVWTPGGFVKIPLGQELRSFYGLGSDMFLFANGKTTATEMGVNLLTGLSTLIPYSPAESVMEGNIASGAPDIVAPLAELGTNKNWLGEPIYKENQKYNPGYESIRTNKKGAPYAPQIMVEFCKFLDNATGGDGTIPGKISPNPDVINHLLGSYLAGLYNQPIYFLEMAAKDSEHGNNKSVAEKLTPSVLWKSSSDIVEKSTGINEKYFELVDNIKETEHYIKSYQNNAEKNMIEMKNDVASGKMSPIEMAEKQQELIQETKDKLQNVSTVKQVVLYHYMNAIHSLEDKEKDMPTDKQNEMASQTLALKKLVLKINNDTKGMNNEQFTKYMTDNADNFKNIK